MTAGPRLAHDWFPRPLPPNVVLGDGSWLYSSFAFVHCRSRRPCAVRVGRSTGIYAGTFFELGAAGEVEIGSYTTLVGAIIRTDRRVVIGDHALLAHEVVLADRPAATPPGRDALAAGAAAGDAFAGGGEPAIVVADNAWIGARAILLAGAVIGEDAIVGAGAVVDREVPAGAVAAGHPLRIRPRRR